MIRGLALSLLLVGCAAPALAATPVETHGALRVQGNRIVDKNGRPVVLRGMSLFWSQWEGDYYNPRVVRTLRDEWNANVVRAAMGVHMGGYLDHPSSEMARVETVVDAAIKDGIYVIVDWHAHDPEPEAAAKFFADIAKKYGKYPNVIYETYNEPLPKYGWASVLKPYHQKVIASIRKYDPDNLVVAGTRTWSQDVDEAAVDPLRDRNTAYTLHFYAGTHKQELRDKAEKAMKLGAPLFVTEWGSVDANGNGKVDVVETQRWFDLMEKNKLSYANWAIDDKPESSAALLPGASPNGHWPDSMISESGRLTRAQLRKMNAPAKGN